MVKNFQKVQDEIDLIELMQIVWKGKWKIVVAAIISLIIMMSYQSIKKKNYTAITEIKPVSTSAINKYIILNNSLNLSKDNTEFNSNAYTNTKSGYFDIADNSSNSDISNDLKFKKITKLKLMNLYLEFLEEKKIFEKAILKYNLLDASQYSNEQNYVAAISKLASSIKILTPKKTNKRNENLEKSYYTIKFSYKDIANWKKVLTYVDKATNQLVKQTLLEDFSTSLLVLKYLKKNKIDLLNNEKNYLLEDLTNEYNNLVNDYDRKISDELAYLKEQSAIAKELGIENGTIETQTFSTQTQGGVLTNINTTTPFYLKGYKAIDKEIELIVSRENKKAFIKELAEIEKSIRNVKQDRRIERIERDQSLDLIEEVIKSSPLGDNKDFHAASINVLATKVTIEGNKKITISLAISIGLIFGVLYVFISHALKFSKAGRKKKIN